MKIDFLTLFPEMCNTVMSESIIGRACKKGIINVNYHNIRDYAYDKHKRVDDTPYGGGMGMLMKADPIFKCFDEICNNSEEKPKLIYMSPRGKVLTQKKVCELSNLKHIAILCGHYEGIDERVIEEIVDEEISIGDYVVTGGELPALILADAICRMIPNVLSSNECFEKESHFNGLLEYSQYTKPYEWHNKKVPDVLISGHHLNIEKYKRKSSLINTLKYRPDLLEKINLTDEDKRIIKEYSKYNNKNNID